MAASGTVRATVIFTGTVQGVGFRYTARRVAERHAVTGYVRNEPDGSVAMVAEGSRAEVEALVDAISARMEGYVRRADVDWAAATGEFRVFGVRFS